MTGVQTCALPISEVAIMSGIYEDLYLILGGWNTDGSITLTVVINPLISWIWYGTGVVILGILWAVMPVRRRDEAVDVLEKDMALLLKGIER